MIINLPQKFSFEDKRNGQSAFVENGILKMSKHTAFRKLMIRIVYKKRGRRMCYYCRKKVPEEDITIDHLYPSDFGGPTIPNNLLPACKKCNNEKRNMTREQYKQFIEAKKEGLQALYYKAIVHKQEEIRSKKQYQIPAKWVIQARVEDVIISIDENEDYQQHKRYHSIEEYYLKYGFIQKPIIVDRKFNLLDGFLEVVFAKNYNLESIPVIVLENVEVMV